MGDPAGIGPEIIVRMLDAHPEFQDEAEIILYGCPEVLEDAAKRFLSGRELPWKVCATGSMKADAFSFGTLSPLCGREAYEAVRAATLDALSGRLDAIVTAPVNKAAVNLAGIPFTGHTELIAELCGTADFAMMQSADSLRVAFVTTHIPLKDVTKFATRERIVETARLLCSAIRAEGIPHPKIGIAAINPHAGENGVIGTEEIREFQPAIRELRSSGLKINGPFPADTLFAGAAYDFKYGIQSYDCYIACYHDQGLIPIKTLAMDECVNTTIGLDILRTSPAHGTAYDIAGFCCARPDSMEAAITAAIK